MNLNVRTLDEWFGKSENFLVKEHKFLKFIKNFIFKYVFFVIVVSCFIVVLARIYIVELVVYSTFLFLCCVNLQLICI